jgi:hypothetical protein
MIKNTVISCSIKDCKWFSDSLRKAIAANGGKLTFETAFTLAEQVVMRKQPGPGMKRFRLFETFDNTGSRLTAYGLATDRDAFELKKIFPKITEVTNEDKLNQDDK